VVERADDERWDEKQSDAGEGGRDEEEPKKVATRLHGGLKSNGAFDCNQCTKEKKLLRPQGMGGCYSTDAECQNPRP
jgi:hypothetical protein